MKKSLSKRIKITKRGKVLRRPMGVNHFKTSKTKKQLRKKRKVKSLGYPKKALVQYLVLA